MAVSAALLSVPDLGHALGSEVRPAAAASLYAYPNGAAASPSSCPRTTAAGQECTLTAALGLVRAGGTVLLATSGKAGTYYGNFTIAAAHTSAKSPVTLEPAPGVSEPVINGDAAAKVGCPTSACDGAVVTVDPHVFARLVSVTITAGDNSSVGGGGGVADLGTASLTKVSITNCVAQVGGGVVVGKGAALTVTGSTLSSDRSTYFGGAIDSGSVIGTTSGSGRLSVASSAFADDHSGRGGAIDSGDGGSGTATITRSTFSHDSASDHGGAIDNADSGKGTMTVTDSTFTNDSAKYGGAIDNADAAGTGSLTVASSTFARDDASHGGAIDNAESGKGILMIRTSTFYADHATAQGSAVDSGDAAGTGTAYLLDSTIDGSVGRQAIARVSGTLQLAGSILAGSFATCTRKITDGGYNLISNTTNVCGLTAGSDLLGVNPRLGPLAKNGGPTETMAPAATSPVLERIPNPAVVELSQAHRVVSLCPVADQRGNKKTESVGCAIGSVDPANGVPVVTSLSATIGAAAGGAAIVIHGGNFAAKATVDFGAVAAHVTKISSTKIDVTVPALPASDSSTTIAVTVKNPSGLVSPYRAADVYSYYTADWSAYLGGAAHSSFNPAATAMSASSVANVQPIWQWLPPTSPNSGGTTDDASPIVYDGVVYVGLEDGYMYAISEATQQVIWSRYLGLELPTTCDGVLGIISTATVADDPVTGQPAVYVNAPDGHLYALDAATGAVLWKSVVGIPSPTIDNFYAWGSPTVANGKVYIGIASNCDVPLVRAGVLAFNQHSGKKVAYWDSLPALVVGASVWSSVVVLPDGDVAATTGNAQGDNNIPYSESIVLLNGSNLKLISSWEAPQNQAAGDSDFGGSPTVFTAYPNGVATTMIGACNKDGIYYALRADDMAAGPLWTHRMGVTTTGPESDECDAAAIWDGHYLIEGGGSQVTINGTSYAGSVQALNPTTGKPVWQTGLTGWVVGSPAEDGAGVIAAPLLYSPTGVSGVYLLSASTGQILRFISSEPRGSFAQPVFDGNDLLIGDDSTALPLTAYSVTTSAQTAPLNVAPADVNPGSTVTLTLTGTGGSGFTSPANVIVSGAQVEVESVQIDNATTATVQVKVLSDAVDGTTLDVTLVEPDLSTYSCTSCLAVS